MSELRGFASPPRGGFAFIGRCLSLCQYRTAIDRYALSLSAYLLFSYVRLASDDELSALLNERPRRAPQPRESLTP
jgi:predicted butyrate kinase (DUF1464 family)